MFFKQKPRRSRPELGQGFQSEEGSLCCFHVSVSFVCTFPRFFFLFFCFQKSLFCHPSISLHPRDLSHLSVCLWSWAVAYPASLPAFPFLARVSFLLDRLETNLFFFAPTFLSSPWALLSYISSTATGTELGVCSSGIVFERRVRGMAGYSGEYNILALNWKDFWEPPWRYCCFCSQTVHMWTHTHGHAQTEWWFGERVGVHTPPLPKITAWWGAREAGRGWFREI